MTCQPYRPSNATEGDIFHAAFCAHCIHERDEDEDGTFCHIWTWANALSIDDAGYPVELVCDEKGPRCTAFVSHDGLMLAYRCSLTPDLFAGAA